MVYQHSGKFGDHRHCDVEDLITLICHMTSHDPVFKRSCDIIGGSPSRYVITLQSLTVISFVAVEIFLICHVHDLARPHDSRAVRIYR